MTSLPDRSISTQLERAHTAISNALEDSQIIDMLVEFGYDTPTLEAGQALFQQAAELQRVQEREYGQQNQATAAVNTAREQAEASYMPLVKVARVALKGDVGALNALGLVGERKKSMTGWADQAQQFYTNALATPAVLTKLARFNITTAKLEAGMATVEALDHARHAQDRERGEAQDSTRTRDQVLDDLNEWMSDFVEVARVALAANPQLLEKLGIRA